MSDDEKLRPLWNALYAAEAAYRARFQEEAEALGAKRDEARAAIARALEQNAKDAARYRFLASRVGVNRTTERGVTFHVFAFPIVTAPRADTDTWFGLDDVIDAEIAAAPSHDTKEQHS